MQLLKVRSRTLTVEHRALLSARLAALFIEVCCKLFADCRWFFYDIWNSYDLLCVVLNSPVDNDVHPNDLSLHSH